jgi:uncharacterized membrane protein YhaH (DUF805 family)
MNYDALFVNPLGRTSRADYVPALLTVLAALAFFGWLVTGRTAHFCMLVLLYPAYVLLARRLQDLGYAVWLVLVPLLPMLVSFAMLLDYLSLGASVDAVLPWVALVVAGAFALWGGVSQGKP